MRTINKFVITLVLACTILSGPKALGWWNLLYTAEDEKDGEEEIEIKFFFLEFLNSVITCKKS